MKDDTIINKIGIIDRCLARVHEEYLDDPKRLENFTVQDSIVLNIQRACEAAIDLAMHVIALRKYSVPQDARNAFEIVSREGVISPKVKERMQAMVGFRNIAVHDYQSLQIKIVSKIIENDIGDFKIFYQSILDYP